MNKKKSVFGVVFFMCGRNGCFYDFDNVCGYYFMKRPGKGFVSFNCNVKLIGFWCLYVYP